MEPLQEEKRKIIKGLSVVEQCIKATSFFMESTKLCCEE